MRRRLMRMITMMILLLILMKVVLMMTSTVVMMVMLVLMMKKMMVMVLLTGFLLFMLLRWRCSLAGSRKGSIKVAVLPVGYASQALRQHLHHSDGYHRSYHRHDHPHQQHHHRHQSQLKVVTLMSINVIAINQKRSIPESTTLAIAKPYILKPITL